MNVMLDEDENDFVLLGKIIKSHGIKGEIKIFPYSGLPENFVDYKEIIVSGNNKEDPFVSFEIEKVRIQGKVVIVKLIGISSRNHAQELIGENVHIRRDHLPQLREDEFYLHDIQGKTALTKESKTIGKISAIMNTAAHDIMVIKDHDREYLVPVCKEFIISIKEDKVVLKLVQGLLEINDS